MKCEIEIYRPFAPDDRNDETLEFDSIKDCATAMEDLLGTEPEEVEELLAQGMDVTDEDIETGRLVTARVKGS